MRRIVPPVLSFREIADKHPGYVVLGIGIPIALLIGSGIGLWQIFVERR
jgi:hypothetical protein